MAESLGLTGYAINLPDGDVTVFACGETAKLDELEAWLRKGPPMSRVDELLPREAEFEDLSGFTTG